MEKVVYKKCPQCELNYIPANEELCESCQEKAGLITPKTPPRNSGGYTETDFAVLISGKVYGTNSREIYKTLCEWLGWDEHQIYRFGRQNQDLFADKADTRRENNVWFISHSNITETKAQSNKRNPANGAEFTNIISNDRNTITENIARSQNANGYDPVNRIVFSKNANGKYEFLGLYKFVKYENYTRYFERISTVYPQNKGE